MTTLGFYFRDMSYAEANEVRRRLNEIAASLGYMARPGPTAGQGNAAAMMVDLAKGELQIARGDIMICKATDRGCEVTMTAERLRAMQDNGMALYWTPGDEKPYWGSESRPSFKYDVQVASPLDFVEAEGFDGLEGFEDDDAFTLEVEEPRQPDVLPQIDPGEGGWTAHLR